MAGSFDGVDGARADVAAAASHGPPEKRSDGAVRGTQDPSSLPYLLTVDEAAEFLRTTPKALYARVARRQIPGVVRDARRVLFRRDHLLRYVARVTSPDGERR
jgi:excisionase family DNA binding protein